jgi:hypothetical protein
MVIDIRITLKRRLATAAAAIVRRMMIRNRPRVLRPELPFSKTSREEWAIMAWKKEQSPN